jgi:hypothetical protein
MLTKNKESVHLSLDPISRDRGGALGARSWRRWRQLGMRHATILLSAAATRPWHRLRNNLYGGSGGQQELEGDLEVNELTGNLEVNKLAGDCENLPRRSCIPTGYNSPPPPASSRLSSTEVIINVTI